MKQALILTLTVLLVFALASCGTDKDQLAYALGHRDSPWNSVEYSPYTAGIAEPEFYYEIMGVNQAEGLCLEFSSEGDELSTWKDSLRQMALSLPIQMPKCGRRKACPTAYRSSETGSIL